MDGVRFPFSRTGASFPPMKVVKAARPGREGTVVEDIMASKEESGEAEIVEAVWPRRLTGFWRETKGGGFRSVRLCDLVARISI